ncbi:MAG: CotH kinase family protein, partial [candidate division KSB1 bacterium]|nr:CotH kinase family protein [candidate division KSB1 bacterium]
MLPTAAIVGVGRHRHGYRTRLINLMIFTFNIMKNSSRSLCSILALFLALFSDGFSENGVPKLFINEFLAANQNAFENAGYHDYADWLEIYSGEDSTVRLDGFYLTDDLSEPFKWRIPDNTILRPGYRLIFWADGRDTVRHTNFRLSKDGEQLGLFSADGIAIDTLTFPVQHTDISYGRLPDGGNDWYYLDQPTPGTANQGKTYDGVCPEPEFSISGGFYNTPLLVRITSPIPTGSIRYTTDGSPPDTMSPLYTTPIRMNSTGIIRARTFQSGHMPSAVVTNTFFINENLTLPAVSVTTDPVNLWSDESGIYVGGTNGIPGYCSNTPKNWNQDWEIPVSLEYYQQNGEPGFRLDAGMKIGGGCTRKYPQKTLAIYARSLYGADKIRYQIFKEKPIDTFNNILLRNHGQDWYRSLMRDGMMQRLVSDRMDIDWQAYQPAILFLNGEYWGIHSIREKHNEHFLAVNHNIDPDAIDILYGNAKVKQGSNLRYLDMIDFISSADMNDPANYAAIRQQTDINEYMNYLIAEIYFANIDWPGGNIKYWRPHGEDGKWRWILFDLDLGFGAHGRGQYDSNTLANATATSATYYANPSWSTLLFRKLLENDDFKDNFIQRFAGHMNTTFKPERVLAIIDSLQTLLAPEIQRHKERWQDSMSFGPSWESLVDILREFAINRPEHMTGHIVDKFDLSGTVAIDIKVTPENGGLIRINNVEMPPENSGSSFFFKDVPMQCSAMPVEGYRFAGWGGLSESLDDSIRVTPARDVRLEAYFEPVTQEMYNGLVINEFLAFNNSVLMDDSGEYDDWIELYNSSDHEIDIGGLYI